MLTNSRKNKDKNELNSLEYLINEGNIKNKGERKNINHLWSSKEYLIELYENIDIPIEIRNDVRRDSFFNNYLMDMVYILTSMDENIELDDAKEIVNLELLLYMSSKCFKQSEFPLENIFLVFSGIKKAMPNNWDLTIVDKINVLFKNHFSKTFVISLIEEYTKLPISKRLFTVEESYYNQIKTTDDEKELEKYKELYTNLMKSKNEILKDIAKDSEISDVALNGFRDKKRFFKEKIAELSSEKHYNFVSVKLNEGSINSKSKIKVFNSIIESHHPYMYTTVLIPFPNLEQCKENALYLQKKSSVDEDRNTPVISDELDNVYSKVSKEAIHTFEMTRFIETRKREKKNVDLDKYSFNLTEAAKLMDKINGFEYWTKRIENIEFKKIFWEDCRPTIKLDSTCTMTLKEASHIVGMLGAGKSTFIRLLNFVAVYNGLKTVIVTKNKESFIELYKDISNDNKNLIEKYNKGNISVFTGYSNRNDSINHLALQSSNILNIDNSISKSVKNGLNIINLTECSSIIASKYRRVFDEEYNKRLDVIPCVPKKNKAKAFQKPMYVANIEYKESGIYAPIMDLTYSDTWIGNVHAFLQTKCPYQLDLYCRDFLTITNIVADLVIVDEIDEIQSIADSNYNVDYGIATSFAKDSNAMIVDYLYREIVGVDRSKYRYEVDEIHRNLILEQQGICDSIMSYLSRNEKRANSEYKQFSYYSLKVKFIRKYFEKEVPSTKDIVAFSELIDNSQVLPHEGFGGSEIKEKIFWLKSIILRKKESSISYKKKADVFKTKQHIDKMGVNYGNIDFYNINDKSSQLAYKNMYMYEVLRLIGKKLDWEICYENVLKSIDEGKKRLNSVFTSDFEFLVLIGTLDNNQKKIDYDTTSFANRVGMKFDISNFISTPISPLFPDPLVKRTYTYSYKAPLSKKSAHRLNIKNYLTIGREILFNYRNTIESLEGVRAPIYVVMSASSYINSSSNYHVNINPSYIIKNTSQNNIRINIKKKFIKSGDKLIKISGSNNTEIKKENLKAMFTGLLRENFFDKEFEHLQQKYDESQKSENKDDRYTQRQRIGIAMPSYELAEIVARHLISSQSKYKVKCLYSNGKKILGADIKQKDYHIKVEAVRELCYDDCDIFVFVIPAIGRGYNMLQKKSPKSLLGTIMFPVRPFLHPEDDMYMIYALHSQLGKMIEDSRKYCLNKYGREEGFLVYKSLKRKSVALYNKMFNSTNFWGFMNEDLKYWMVANFLVIILQTIGRGLRGGTNLNVYLLDASFAGERVIKSIEESEALIPVDIEEERTESFLSVCKDILSNGDEIFNMINKPLIEGFNNIEWGI